ncbi:MAG TPA: dockerin type I domain-containing protein, partial [candidate division Zixibacteria bacterium]|nr:dockerin type I domain-containing protein [candidate division Zixibacteria bacterium]
YPSDGGNIVVSSMYDFSIVDSFQFRPLGEPSANDLDSVYYYGSSGEFTTQDSTLGLISEYWSPKTGVPAGWRAVFLRTGLTNRTAATINDVRFAYAWDWDVPSDSGARNTSGFDAANYIVWLRGSEFGADTGNTACIDNDRRFAAVGYYPADDVDYLDYFVTGGGPGSAGFQAQHTRDNRTFVGGDWHHVALDSMLTNIVDFDIYETLAPDSLLGVDLHMVVNTGSYDIAPGDTVYLHTLMLTGIASDNNPGNDLSVVWQSAYESAPWRNTCCDSPGDFDNNGVYGIGDITALIAYIFSGGPGPDCEAEGDFNGDGSLNISDVTAGIQYIFSGGAPPVCGPL